MANRRFVGTLESAGTFLLRKWKRFWFWLTRPSIKTKVSYTAVVLYEAHQQQLLNTFKSADGWTAYAHHMTICLGNYQECLPPLGTEFCLVVHAIRQDE